MAVTACPRDGTRCSWIWVHRFAKIRDGSVSTTRHFLSTDCCRGGVAILAPCSRRLNYASRPNPDGCQLERNLAGTRGNVEPERFIDEGGSPIQHPLEQRLSRRVLRSRTAVMVEGGKRCP